MLKPILKTVFLSALVAPTYATAEELHIRIDSDVHRASGTRILVAPFGNQAKIIEEDLQRSGRFALVDPSRAGSLDPLKV